MEWILEWVRANYDAIIAFVTSSTFLTLLVFVYNLVHNSKLTKANTEKTNKLTSALTTVTDTKNSIDDNTESVTRLENEIRCLRELETAILEILNIVFTRSKDDGVRNSVTNIITSLKYRKDETIETLENKIKELEHVVKLLKKEVIVKEPEQDVDVKDDNLIIRG